MTDDDIGSKTISKAWKIYGKCRSMKNLWKMHNNDALVNSVFYDFANKMI